MPPQIGPIPEFNSIFKQNKYFGTSCFVVQIQFHKISKPYNWVQVYIVCLLDQAKPDKILRFSKLGFYSQSLIQALSEVLVAWDNRCGGKRDTFMYTFLRDKSHVIL